MRKSRFTEEQKGLLVCLDRRAGPTPDRAQRACRRGGSVPHMHVTGDVSYLLRYRPRLVSVRLVPSGNRIAAQLTAADRRSCT